jgi:hypothetical protein
LFSSLLGLSVGPWKQGADGAWRVLPAEVVALSATAEDPDDLTDTERDALDNSDEWVEFVRNEVADIVQRWESAR